MKLANERGVEIALQDLEQIRGGAGIRFFRSEAELAKIGRGLQQYATGLLEPLDMLMFRAPGSTSPELLEPPQHDGDDGFGVQEPEQYVRLLEAR